ncbi:MAG: porin [Gemmatimonadales bacterium]|nr:porin [Gemmatimonadales bacterium]
MRRILLFSAGLWAVPLAAQGDPGLTVDGRGVTFTSADSATRITMRFRIQQLLTVRSDDDDDQGIDQVAFQIRRARFRLGGTVGDPRLSFNLQLSFSRSDLDSRDTDFSNVLRDAAVAWRFSPNFQTIMGQTKLPGNRQRVISSGDLELPERSIVNSRFTLDRDVGVQFWWADTLGGTPVHLRTALSNGDGRNPDGNDNGLAYTARLEWQPLGPFVGGSDDFEGDLLRNPSPRLALAATTQYNDKAVRTGGQLGPRLHDPRSMTTYEADLLFKYRGLAVYSEVATRNADDPITTAVGEPNRFVYVGWGRLVQVSYQIGNGFAPVARWALVTPDNVIANEAGGARQEQWGGGITKYFNRHRVKTTVEVLHDKVSANAAAAEREGWIGRWALEVGI